ncbi:hypothetical protein Btru_030896 [Bulinus truncatus]|nr:hypothetical protein Btru_030896 [Bulinus truncatus]
MRTLSFSYPEDYADRLVRAHTNLCFLLRNQFPELFMRKRSVDSPDFDIYSMPVDTFADMDLSNIFPDHDFEKRNNILPGIDALPGAITETSNNKPAELSEIRSLKDLFQSLKYRFLNSRPKRQANEVNILCSAAS